MSHASPFTRAFFVSLLCAAGFGCVAVLVTANKFTSVDKAIIEYVQGFESPALTRVMTFFTVIGTGLPIVLITLAIAIFLYIGLRHRKEVIFLIVTVIGSALLNTLLKLIFYRERPTLHRIYEAAGYSFPSGHAMAAFSLYATVAFLLWQHVPHTFGRVCVILISSFLILAIGVSRIYLGVHYPSDIIGGYLASGCWLAASVWVYRRYWDRGSREKS